MCFVRTSNALNVVLLLWVNCYSCCNYNPHTNWLQLMVFSKLEKLLRIYCEKNMLAINLAFFRIPFAKFSINLFFAKKRAKYRFYSRNRLMQFLAKFAQNFFLEILNRFFLRINTREKVCEVGKESRNFSFFRGDKCLSCILISAEYTVFTRTVGVN